MDNLIAQNVFLAERCIEQQKQLDELRSQVNSLLVAFSNTDTDKGKQPFGNHAGDMSFQEYSINRQKLPQMKKIQKAAKDMREKNGQEILEKMTSDAMKIENELTAKTVINKFPVGITGADLIKELISQGVTIP